MTEWMVCSDPLGSRMVLVWGVTGRGGGLALLWTKEFKVKLLAMISFTLMWRSLAQSLSRSYGVLLAFMVKQNEN